MSVTIRRATNADGSAIRSLVTRQLLSAGFDVPDDVRDSDLLDLAYYQEPGRAAWVALWDNVIVGCIAVDHGDAGTAVVRRLAGGALEDLVRTAVAFAQGRSFRVMEAVAPSGLAGTREALAAAGFAAASEENQLLLRRSL